MSIRLSHKPGDFLDPKNGQHRLEHHLKTGGMGSVYRAVDTFTGAPKAVKECDILDDPRGKGLSRAEAVSIFLDEARCIEDLKHDGIPGGGLHVVQQEDLRLCLRCGNAVSEAHCSLCDLPADDLYHEPAAIDYRYYLVMEFIEGADLQEVVAEMPRPLHQRDLGKIFDALAQVAGILEYVHGRKLAHCDVKPENIRIRKDGQLFLLDFGLQRMESTSRNTRVLKGGKTGLGTPGYAAPEQEAGNPRYASDSYALSMTALHLITGLDPANPLDRRRILESRPRDLVTDLAPDIDDLLYHGLSQDPNLRPTARAWREILSGVPPLAKKPRNSGPPPIPKQKLARPPLFDGARLRAQLVGSARPLLLLLTLLLVLSVGYWAFMHTPAADLTTGKAQRNARIYRKPGTTEVLRRLKGGEALVLRKVKSGVKGYWFRVLEVAGEEATGYIDRGGFQMDKPREKAP